MTAMPRLRPLSLDEAVEVVYRAALDGRSVAEAAAEVVHDIDDRDINEAIVIGLGELVHRRLARQRRGHTEDGGAEVAPEVEAESGPVVPPLAAKRHAAKDLWTALDANYGVADGSRKALKDFTVEDALYLREQSNAKADGYVRVRDAMDRAISALRKHGAATIGSLPVEAKRKVAEGLS